MKEFAMRHSRVWAAKLKEWTVGNWAIGLALLLLFAAWRCTPYLVCWLMGPVSADALQSAGQFGDQFGAINALFTALTVLLVFIAFREERNDRIEAESRWRKEREESDADRRMAEVDRRVKHFFDALERYVNAREGTRFRWPEVEALREGKDLTSGANAIGQHHANLKAALEVEPRAYLAADTAEARVEFAKRVLTWFRGANGQALRPMLAHVATMNWATRFVAAQKSDQEAASGSSTHAMLLSAARGVISEDEFALFATYGLIDSNTRRFVLDVFDVDSAKQSLFAQHQLVWLARGIIQVPDDAEWGSNMAMAKQ